MMAERFQGRASAVGAAVLGLLLLLAFAPSLSAGTLSLRAPADTAMSYEIWSASSGGSLLSSGTLEAGATSAPYTFTDGNQMWVMSYPSSGSRWYAGNTGTLLICMVSGSAGSACPAASYTNYTASPIWCNSGVLALPVSLYAGTCGAMTWITNQTALPGECVQLQLQRTNAFCWSYNWTNFQNVALVLTNGGSVELVTDALLPNVTTPTVLASLLFTNTILPTVPSAVLPGAPTNQARATDYTSTTLAIQTLDANQDAREKESREVYIAGLGQQYRQAAAQVQATAAGTLTVAQYIAAQTAAQNSAAANQAAQTATVASNVAATTAAVQSLANQLGSAPTDSGTGVPTNTFGFGAGTNQSPSMTTIMAGFLPAVSSITADPGFHLIIPFGSLGITGLTDYDADMYVTAIDQIVPKIRLFFLLVVTVSFILSTIRLVAKLA